MTKCEKWKLRYLKWDLPFGILWKLHKWDFGIIKLKYQKFSSFNYRCCDTIDNCLYALFTSENFEESIKKVISYGGDTDTNARIVGSMAEAMYGVNKNLIKEAQKKIPNEFVKVLEKGYKNIGHKL